MVLVVGLAVPGGLRAQGRDPGARIMDSGVTTVPDRPLDRAALPAVGPAAALRITSGASARLAERPLPPTLHGLSAAEVRVVVSIEDRVLRVLADGVPVLEAPVGVASGMTLAYADRTWRFRTPRGVRRVLAKSRHPVWRPPQWHYAEVARDYGLSLARMPASGVRISAGRRLTIREGRAGVRAADGSWAPLPLDEHIVFDHTLFVPPPGSLNRRIEGELGAYALDLGDGYLIHGTPDEATVGEASTHGCLRMRAADLAWVYASVPVGARVTIR